MNTTPRLLKDLAEREAKENGTNEDGTKTSNGNGNAKPTTNGTPKPLVVTKTPKGPRLTRAAAKVAKTSIKPNVSSSWKTGKAANGTARVSKMSKAKELYAKMIKEKKDRKQILDAFVKTVGLTKAGAKTYYQLIRSKK